jgi:hypothetical protein
MHSPITPLSATPGARGRPYQEIEKQKKKGGKPPVDLVKLAKIAISPVLGKGLAEFEVAFTNQNDKL